MQSKIFEKGWNRVKKLKESQERSKENKERTGKEENAGDGTGYSGIYTDTGADGDVSFCVISSIPLHSARRPAFGHLYLKKLDRGTEQDCFCSADMFVCCLRAFLRRYMALSYFL